VVEKSKADNMELQEWGRWPKEKTSWYNTFVDASG
jgi:hypothetical protein